MTAAARTFPRHSRRHRPGAAPRLGSRIRLRPARAFSRFVWAEAPRNKHGAGYSFGPPKSRAGRRVVAFPDLIAPDLRKHLAALSGGAPLAFTSPTGSPLTNSNFRRRVWLPALGTVGLSGVHFHDLRHTGNQFTAAAGANPRELMARMGHDSPRAVLIYLHSSGQRQRALADAVGDAARTELAKSKKRKAAKPSGTRKARRQDDRAKS